MLDRLSYPTWLIKPDGWQAHVILPSNSTVFSLASASSEVLPQSIRQVSKQSNGSENGEVRLGFSQGPKPLRSCQALGATCVQPLLSGCFPAYAKRKLVG